MKKRQAGSIGGSLFYAVSAIAISLLFVLSNAVGVILYVPVAAIVSLVLLVRVVYAKGSRRLAALSMLVIYGVGSYTLCKNYDDARTTLRWFLWSRSFKAQVLAQPDHLDGGWKHLEWDGWGFAGAGDTSVYLVFDPGNSLAKAAETHSSGVVFTPVARIVPRVRRLENSWYSVVFYTQTDWNSGD